MTEIGYAALALACGLLCLPGPVARYRITRLVRARAVRLRTGGQFVGGHALPVWVPTGVAALAGWLSAGIATGLAAGLLVATCWARWRSRRDIEGRLAALAALGRALGAVAAQLRAGAHPATAAADAAGDVDRGTSEVLTTLAGTARLGGDVTESLLALRAARPEIEYALARMGRAWRLAEHSGIGLAELFDSVREDVEHRVRFARSVTARMAGPRTSALVLGWLPVLGIGLGELIGAGALRVLFTEPTGQVLLVVGCGLICAGLIWSGRLTSTVGAT